MSQIEEVVLKLAESVENLQQEVSEIKEAYGSLQNALILAFRETGFDFSKIGQSVPSRRTAISLAHGANYSLNPEELDPDLQDEIARKILAENPPNHNQEAINKQQDGFIKGQTE